MCKGPLQRRVALHANLYTAATNTRAGSQARARDRLAIRQSAAAETSMRRLRGLNPVSLIFALGASKEMLCRGSIVMVAPGREREWERGDGV